MEKKQMAGISRTLLATLMLLVLVGCSNNEPTAYTSIKGTWRCAEISPAGTRTYSVDIYRTKSDTTVYLLSNFHNVSFEGIYDIRASLSGKTLKINPFPQPIGDSGYIINIGTGTVNNDFTRIDLEYIINDGKTDLLVKAVYTR